MNEGATIRFRTHRMLMYLGTAVLLFFLAGCSPRESRQTFVPAAAADTLATRVQAIQEEVKRIDTAIEAPPSAKLQRARKNLPHWEFSGTFDSSKPLQLSARFSQGEFVREETYYLRAGKLLFVRIERWWDVDGANRAPEPKAWRDFYIENNQTIRSVLEMASSPPVSQTNDAQRPAEHLVERSRLLAQVLLGGGQDAAIAEALELFPDAEMSQP